MSARKTLVKAVEDCFTLNFPFDPLDNILAAVSGGADSMALLHTLYLLKQEKDMTVQAVHVNHGLRGEEATRDEEFVKAECAKRGIPLEILHTDVAAAAQAGEGIEAAGRRIRYAFFEEIRQKYHLEYIVTAHTMDDNLETVLLHLARGTTLHGLRGIQAASGSIVRPLLSCTREEIEAFCKEESVSFIEDSTNTDVTFSRNRIRHEVVPALKKINPNLTKTVNRMINRLTEDDLFLSQQAAALLVSAKQKTDVYDALILRDASAAICRRVLKAIIDDGAQAGEDRHVAVLFDALHRGQGALQVCPDMRVVVNADTLYVERGRKEKTPYFEMPLTLGQTYDLAGKTYTFQCITREKFEKIQNVHKNVLKFACDYDKIANGIYARARMAGDTFHPVGGVGKTLKKYFNEYAVAPQKRASIPLVCDDSGIVLITGFSCDNRVCLDEYTEHVLLFYPNDVEWRKML